MPSRESQQENINITFLSRNCAGEIVGTEGEERHVAEQIVDSHLRSQGWSGRDVVLGVTGVFLSDAALEVLETQRMGITPRSRMATMPSSNSIDQLHDSVDGLNRSTFGRSESKLNLLDNASNFDLTERKSGIRPKTMMSEWGGVVSGGDIFSNLPSQSHLSAQAMEKGFLSEVVEEIPTSSQRKRWMFLVWLLTWYIPDFGLRLLGPKKFKRKDVRTAWREKLAINYLIWLACAASIFFIAFFGDIICPKQNVFTYYSTASPLTLDPRKSPLRLSTRQSRRNLHMFPFAGKFSTCSNSPHDIIQPLFRRPKSWVTPEKMLPRSSQYKSPRSVTVRTAMVSILPLHCHSPAEICHPPIRMLFSTTLERRPTTLDRTGISNK